MEKATNLEDFNGKPEHKKSRKSFTENVFKDLDMSDDYYLGQILSPKDIETVPSGCIPLGWTVYNKKLHRKDFRSKPLFLKYDVNARGEGRNIFVYGKAGSGKTFLVRSMIDRHKITGFNVCILTDVKNEYKTSLKIGTSTKIMTDYDEKLQSQNMTIYRPMFFGEPFDTGQNYQIMQFCVNDLKRIDWMQLLEIHPSDPKDTNKRLIFETIWRYINNDEIENINMDAITTFVTNTSDIDERNKKTFLKRLKVLQESNVIGTMHNVIDSLRADLEEKKTIVINLENYENFFLYSQIYIAIINRILAGFQSEIKIPLEIIVDEANAFIPQDGDTSSKEEIMLNINRRRYLGIKMTVSTQRIKDVSENLISQSSVVFIPSNPDREEFFYLVKKIGLSVQYGGSNTKHTSDWWRSVLSDVKRFQWIVIDKDNGNSIDIFEPCHPLSHQQSSQ